MADVRGCPVAGPLCDARASWVAMVMDRVEAMEAEAEALRARLAGLERTMAPQAYGVFVRCSCCDAALLERAMRRVRDVTHAVCDTAVFYTTDVEVVPLHALGRRTDLLQGGVYIGLPRASGAWQDCAGLMRALSAMEVEGEHIGAEVCTMQERVRVLSVFMTAVLDAETHGHCKEGGVPTPSTA